MSLRINQNVLSLSTYGNLNAASNRLENSIQKLSSGLRINSAADDAAGLAISEKMRRQIRGLGRAVLNAQDGVSMIQTAEGALNETQSIIQRMRELALESANDTLTSNDRLEIQKEVDQLKTQLDSIANSTEFNTKKLLNGNQAALVTSSSTFVNGIVTGAANGSGDFTVSLSTINGGISQVQRSQIFKNKNTGELATGSTRLQDIDAFYDADGVFALESTQTLTISGNANSSNIVLDGLMTLNDLAASLQQAISSQSGLGISNTGASVMTENATGVTGDGGYIQITSGFVGENGEFSIAGSQDIIDALGFSITREAVNNMVNASIKDEYGNSRNIVTSNDKAVGLLSGIDIQFASSPAQIAGNGGLSDGLRIGPAAETFKVIYDDKSVAPNVIRSVQITIQQGDWSLQGLARNINAQLAAATPDAAAAGFAASIQDGQIKIAFNPTSPVQPSNFTLGNVVGDSLGLLQGDYNGFVMGEKDKADELYGFSKVMEGQTTATAINFKVGDDNASTVINAYTTIPDTAAGHQVPDLVEIKQWLSSVNSTLTGANIDIRVDEVSDSLVFTSNLVGNSNTEKSKVTLEGNGGALDSIALKAFGFTQSIAYGSGDTNFRVHVVDTKPQFQIGADAGDNMKIAIGDMSAAALGIDKIDLTSVEGSTSALEKLNQALDVVSSQRSLLGAYQNRLEYSISNLQNSSTNLTAAESRIRDVDVADEMTEYTRNQIVSQAATSMLAQANSMPQTALQLLQQ